MLLPQDWERVAQERMNDLHREAQQRHLLAQFPSPPSPLQQWAGRGMMLLGAWLVRLGERIARRDCVESVSAAG